MTASLYHLLLALPIFAVLLMFLVLPAMQWLSVRMHHRKFVLRFGGRWNAHDVNCKRDLIFSLVVLLITLCASFLVLEALINKGILPPLG